MTDARTQAAAAALLPAQELEVAAQHLRTAAAHMTAGEVPRSAAHLLAGRGHLLKAGATLDALAVEHAARSHPTPD
ncbi:MULTISPECIES: hypothetical protein [Deinococcus]|uniref:Uncharacterized protein n=1 Tax=Deinococcus rufus TaxID=2136097 RepID=A0ABV7Z530_9DEIO|nr:hypothetical protein [Deinococcus sp. AB2017081]WQE96280.1 hypothetical protein U2P90_05135 [Deinococcus sp. AB2017081]